MNAVLPPSPVSFEHAVKITVFPLCEIRQLGLPLKLGFCAHTGAAVKAAAIRSVAISIARRIFFAIPSV
jgi:hypothetical protein